MEEKYPPLNLIYQINTTADRIFDAWVKTDIMERWLFKSPENKIVSIENDLVIGGRFSILELNNNEEIDHFGVYLEIEKSSRLSFTLEVPRHYSGVSKVAIEIKQKGTACAMILLSPRLM